MTNREVGNGKKELYIIITNSLQNDFLEYKDLKNDGYWIDYNKIEDKWGNYFGTYDGIPIESAIEKLINIISDRREEFDKLSGMSHSEIVEYVCECLRGDITIEELFED